MESNILNDLINELNLLSAIYDFNEGYVNEGIESVESFNEFKSKYNIKPQKVDINKNIAHFYLNKDDVKKLKSRSNQYKIKAQKITIENDFCDHWTFQHQDGENLDERSYISGPNQVLLDSEKKGDRLTIDDILFSVRYLTNNPNNVIEEFEIDWDRTTEDELYLIVYFSQN
jgi:hypothetical protein